MPNPFDMRMKVEIKDPAGVLEALEKYRDALDLMARARHALGEATSELEQAVKRGVALDNVLYSGGRDD